MWKIQLVPRLVARRVRAGQPIGNNEAPFRIIVGATVDNVRRPKLFSAFQYPAKSG
jgi:hypothetical protein